MGAGRSALIVAADAYQDPGLSRLRSPAHDAEALARALRAPEIGGFDVRTMLNEPAYVVSEAVEEFFADRARDDLLLLHFSCHGVKDEDGELYFATANTKLRRLGATAVAADFVNRRMSRSRSRRVVLLLDCCYAGAFERGMTARAGSAVGIEDRFGGRGRAVITASSALEYAFEGEELADARDPTPSVFTRALVEGLESGDADRDQDGMIALDELYDYVYDKVREVTPNQTPGKWTFGVQGELYIARRSRPVSTPAPLPAGLAEALDHPLAGIRAGALQELETRRPDGPGREHRPRRNRDRAARGRGRRDPRASDARDTRERQRRARERRLRGARARRPTRRLTRRIHRDTVRADVSPRDRPHHCCRSTTGGHQWPCGPDDHPNPALRQPRWRVPLGHGDRR